MAFHSLLGKYSVTDHALEQYDGRVKFKSRESLLKSISFDLKILNIKKIVRNEHIVHVFTKGYKEFIFVKSTNNKKLTLKTVIKRNTEDTKRTIYKRQNNLVTC